MSFLKNIRGDHDRATLFLYFLQVGDPRQGVGAEAWAGTSELDLLIGVTGWSEARARRALERAVACGYATRRQEGSD